MQSVDLPDRGVGQLNEWQGKFSAAIPEKASTTKTSASQLFTAIVLLAVMLLLVSLVQILRPSMFDPLIATGAVTLFTILLIGVGWMWLRSDQSAANAKILRDYKKTSNALTTIRKRQRQLMRRYREEKLRAEAASRSKTAFLAHLSHDVRTPLNHIIGFAELIRHQAFGPIGDERYLSYVEDIKKSGERLLFSFAEILELAELDAGKRVLQSTQIDVDDLLTTLQDQFQSAANHCGISFEITGASGVVLNGDRGCLLRMLANLLDNSMRFTPTGGKVSVAVWQADDGVVLCVTDTGIGIPQERMEALSAPFALDDATFSRGQNGLGLGLAISRTIAELSGGELVIESTPSIGTTVAISLPMEAPKIGVIRTAA